jgi:hypothetical protein
VVLQSDYPALDLRGIIASNRAQDCPRNSLEPDLRSLPSPIEKRCVAPSVELASLIGTKDSCHETQVSPPQAPVSCQIHPLLGSAHNSGEPNNRGLDPKVFLKWLRQAGAAVLLIGTFIIGIIDRVEAVPLSVVFPAKECRPGISKVVLVDDIPVKTKFFHPFSVNIHQTNKLIDRQNVSIGCSGHKSTWSDNIITRIFVRIGPFGGKQKIGIDGTAKNSGIRCSGINYAEGDGNLITINRLERLSNPSHSQYGTMSRKKFSASKINTFLSQASLSSCNTGQNDCENCNKDGGNSRDGCRNLVGMNNEEITNAAQQSALAFIAGAIVTALGLTAFAIIFGRWISR